MGNKVNKKIFLVSFENGVLTFKNKYVVVYENKALYVCKIFGSDDVLKIYKDNCITKEKFEQDREYLNLNHRFFQRYVVTNGENIDIKFNSIINEKLKELSKLKQEKVELNDRAQRLEHDIVFIKERINRLGEKIKDKEKEIELISEDGNALENFN